MLLNYLNGDYVDEKKVSLINEHFLIYLSRVQVKRLHIAIAMAIGKKAKNR